MKILTTGITVLLLMQSTARGRSTAGLESQNDFEKIILWKSERKKD